jgi:cytochrome c oxidase assembly protein subunit 15
MFLISGATSLYSRRHGPHIKVSAPTKTVSLLSQTHIVISFIVLILGTIVTGSGPHAGDEKAQRFGFDIQTVAWIHADVVIFLLGTTFAFFVATGTTQATKRRLKIFAVIALAQGAIGYIQYFTGIPEVLVAAHLLGATLVWIAAWRVWLSVTTRNG